MKNSNSIYGLYHPWRQYPIRSSLKIYCKVRANETYCGEIGRLSQEETVMAIYNSSGKMIKCTGYYNDKKLINKYDDASYACVTVWDTIKPDTYTVKCLSVGKGLKIGESGTSIKVVVPDRSALINNNYGLMPYLSQVITSDFIFDVSGLLFDAESTMESIGTLRPTKYYEHITVTPSPEDFDYRVQPPLDYTYKHGNMYYIHNKLKIYQINSFESFSEITEIDFNNYLGEGSVEYANICDANGLEFDPANNLINIPKYEWVCDRLGSIGTNGTLESYWRRHELYVANRELTIYGILDSYVGYAFDEYQDNYLLNDTEISIGFSKPKMEINNQVYTGSDMAWMRIKTNFSHDSYTINGYRLELIESVDYYYHEPIEEFYNARLPIAKKLKDEIYHTVFEDENTQIKKTTWDRATGCSVPMDAIFGHLDPNKSIGAIESLPTTYNEVSNGVGGHTFTYEPMLTNYMADLTAYDPDHQCNNKSMWGLLNGKRYFVSQKSIPIELGEIPDHKIG